MEKSDITYDTVSEEMENFIIQDIINQYEYDTDFANHKQNYWIVQKRDNRLNKILVD